MAKYLTSPSELLDIWKPEAERMNQPDQDNKMERNAAPA